MSHERPRSDDARRGWLLASPALGWLHWSVPSGAGFESTRRLARWLVLSTIIGLVAGAGAIAFTNGIDLATHLFLGDLASYLPPSPAGEGTTPVMPIGNPFVLPLVVALGGLISGIIVFTLAPEAEGHGTDAAIAAIHHHGGRIRARIPPIKLVASAITIGSGGSAGREGPAAQISAGFGSLLSDWLRLSSTDRRIAVAAGIGAGIGAIFRAPLGGAVLAAEILYIHDLEVEALLPGLIASIVGYTLYGAIMGFTPIFGNQPTLALGSPVQLVYYALLGVLAGIMGLLYARCFHGASHLFHRLPLPRWAKPAIGGLIVGLIGLAFPQALHTGYGWVQIGMTPEMLGLPLWLVLLLPFAKILATSISIGSGGSGGIFGPGMVIGGILGAAAWRVGMLFLPGMPEGPAPFVIVGMMATFGGIAHAPLAVMLMVAEMTGNLSLLAPAMIAVAISTALVGNNTIYESQLPTRANSPAHRSRFSFPLLSALLVRDAMRPAIALAGNGAAAATGEAEQDITLAPDTPLDEALDRLAAARASTATVVDDNHSVGSVDVRDIIRTYKATLSRSIRRVRALPPGPAIFEVRLSVASSIVGKPLHAAGLPVGILVAAINRAGETIFPRADTVLEPDDIATIVADPANEARLRDFFEGTELARRR